MGVDRSVVGRRDEAREERLREVWDAHAGTLLAWVTRLVGGDRARAEDVVQEVMLRAWRHPAALDETRGPVLPWLYTVARRIVIDQQRARVSRPPEVGDAGLAALPTDDGLEARLDRLVVADAVASLSADHRAVLVETYFRGHTVAEAAVVLEVPVGTVKSRCHYAMRALALALRERGVTA